MDAVAVFVSKEHVKTPRSEAPLVYIYIYIYIYIHIYMIYIYVIYIYIYIERERDVCVCTYIYIYTYIYVTIISIYIYIYICICNIERGVFAPPRLASPPPTASRPAVAGADACGLFVLLFGSCIVIITFPPERTPRGPGLRCSWFLFVPLVCFVVIVICLHLYLSSLSFVCCFMYVANAAGYEEAGRWLLRSGS